MRRLWAALAVVGMLAGCQQEIEGPGGTEQPAANVRCMGCTYLPVCDSTKLTYVDSTALGVDTTATTLAILGDTTITGRKYNRVTAFAGFNQGLLYNCNGGEYRIYQPVPDIGVDVDSLLQAITLPFPVTGVTVPPKIQTTILKANAAAGAAWSDTVFTFSPIPFVTVVAKFDYKIEEKGVQRTVLGKAYNNVIRVSSKLNLVVPLVPVPVDVSVHYWFAPEVGIIESRTTSNGTVQSATKLLR